MIDIKLLRADPELVKENIRKKFQDEKLVLVDEVVEMDAEWRAAHTRCDALRNQRNVISKQIGGDRKSTRLNSSHRCTSRMPSSA